MQVQPYLFFDGRCDEALAFYQKTVGAKVGMLMRFKESPDQTGIPPGASDKVMHAAVKIGDSEVFVSDGHCKGSAKFEGFGIALSVANEAEADRVFNGLVEGGQTVMPLGKTFFSPRFGIAADKFGVTWMVMVQPKG